MKASVNMKSVKVRRTWLAGASLPALMLASSMAVVGLNAQPASADTRGSESRTAGEAVSDAWITTKVKSQLVADTEVAGFDISVETRDGVVNLSGEVENQSQVNHAVEIARSTEGVKRVNATALRIATAVDQAREAVGRSDD